MIWTAGGQVVHAVGQAVGPWLPMVRRVGGGRRRPAGQADEGRIVRIQACGYA